MCNMDCFNCTLPDCTNNSLETREEKKMRTGVDISRQRRYYYRNREKAIEKQKEYNRQHKEERSAYYKKYYAEHREDIIKRESERIKRKRKSNKEWAQKQRDKARTKYWEKKCGLNGVENV